MAEIPVATHEPWEAPIRIQRRRTKGWRMPEGAIYVGRPSVWGNWFKVGEVLDAPFVWHVDSAAAAVVDGLVTITPTIAVDLFRARVTARTWAIVDRGREGLISDLAGHDLVCWCPLDQPCHADVLLEVANR